MNASISYLLKDHLISFIDIGAVTKKLQSTVILYPSDSSMQSCGAVLRVRNEEYT
jgi:hypothetical protein